MLRFENMKFVSSLQSSRGVRSVGAWSRNVRSRGAIRAYWGPFSPTKCARTWKRVDFHFLILVLDLLWSWSWFCIPFYSEQVATVSGCTASEYLSTKPILSIRYSSRINYTNIVNILFLTSNNKLFINQHKIN